MKQSLFSFLLGGVLTSLLAFQMPDFSPDASTAQVQQIDGFYVFCDARPVMPYDSLGMVTLSFVSGTQYESIRNSLMARARRKYADANGIILNLNRTWIDRATVIRFR
jgi:hypothetical protein